MTIFIKRTIRINDSSTGITIMDTLSELGYHYDILFSQTGIIKQICTYEDGSYCTFSSKTNITTAISMAEFLTQHHQVNGMHDILTNVDSFKEPNNLNETKTDVKTSIPFIRYGAVFIALIVFIIVLHFYIGKSL